ncbi:MAG: hypothetical protein ACYDEX_19135 [Mobilitalea sp.]
MIDFTIIDLKKKGIWEELDFYVRYNLHTQQASTLNWKGNVYNHIGYNAPTWEAKKGFSTGHNGYLNTGFSPTRGDKFKLGNNSFGLNIMSEPGESPNGIMGSRNGNRTYLVAKTITTNYTTIYNSGTQYIAINHGSRIKALANRRLGTSMSNIQNGNLNTQIKAEGVFDDLNFYVLAMNYANTLAISADGALVSDSWAGSAMDATKHMNFYNVNKYFNDNIGGTF